MENLENKTRGSGKMLALGMIALAATTLTLARCNGTGYSSATLVENQVDPVIIGISHMMEDPYIEKARLKYAKEYGVTDIINRGTFDFERYNND